MNTASLALIIGSSVLAAAMPAQLPLGVDRFSDTICKPVPSSCDPNPLTPAAIYYGGQEPSCEIPTHLRISNGGAGLSGLVGYLADGFIKFAMTKYKTGPFKVEWIKGDTTETLAYLETLQTDVGITYNKAAECQSRATQMSVRREYGFRDHFYLVGPKVGSKGENPAGLVPKQGDKKEDILAQFQKIVRTGNNPPAKGKSTRFLSRYDKSATNIKDSELFVRIGQVPWGLAYSKWYHQYTMYPTDALQAAALLQEYTITDRGTWLSTGSEYTKNLTIYNEGTDSDPADPLLNPAFFLSTNRTCSTNVLMADRFLSWVISPDGQNAVKEFKKEGEYLYTPAPDSPNQAIKDCKIPAP